jgi:hypothetical protein
MTAPTPQYTITKIHASGWYVSRDGVKVGPQYIRRNHCLAAIRELKELDAKVKS